MACIQLQFSGAFDVWNVGSSRMGLEDVKL